MSRAILSLSLVAAALAAALCAEPAVAQATRTWVSGVGDDANPCNRLAPCKTFAGAIGKTAVNGIINCMDDGAYGVVTITKSVTIDCHGNLAGLLASSIFGITINAPGTSDPLRTVHLRNLRIDGSGGGSRTGTIGIRILSGLAVYIDNVVVQNFTQHGIDVTTNSNTNVFIRDSQISDNAQFGLNVAPLASQVARVTLDNVHLDRNMGGIRATRTAPGTAIVTLNDTHVEGSFGNGVVASGSNAVFFLNGSVVTRNGGAGLASVDGGQFFSFQNNVLAGNTDANAATTPVPLQ